MDDAERRSAIRELYDRLRLIARSRMAGQANSHTLDPTGLANEAILRLLKCDPRSIRDDDHFLALAAEAMRQILVDHARSKAADKRGGGRRSMDFSDRFEEISFHAEPRDILAASEALAALEAEDSDTGTLVKLRLFAGLSPDELAALMGTSKRTVERRWRYAIASLRQRLQSSESKGLEHEEHERQSH